MPQDSLTLRVEAVTRLTNLFKVERIIHLIVTTFSLLLLLSSVLYSFIEKTSNPVTLTGMFGSSGLIAYSANRLLWMWDQAMQMLNTSDKDKEIVG